MMRGGEGNCGACSSADLLRACGSGLTDAELWEEFQRRFQRRIFLYLLRSGGQVIEEERDLSVQIADLAQEVYMRLVQNDGIALRSFRGESDFSVFTFLARVARNVVRDQFRYDDAVKRKATVIPIEEARRRAERSESDRLLAGGESGEDVLRLVDVERSLERAASGRKPARDVLIFKLYYLEGFTADEIAAFPGFRLSANGVETVLTRMREKLNRI